MEKTKINKEGKITVKHFLNTRLKGRLQDNGELAYPLYVRIRVKDQQTEFKSRIAVFVSPEQFEWFLRENKTHIEHDIYVLTDIVKRLKPFEKQQFSLDSITRRYAIQDIRAQLKEGLKEAVATSYLNSKESGNFNDSTTEYDGDEYLYRSQLIEDHPLLKIIDWNLDPSLILGSLKELAPYARKELEKLEKQYKTALELERGYNGLIKTFKA